MYSHWDWALQSEKTHSMAWLLAALGALFLATLYIGVFYLSSPSRGELADKQGRRIQARLKAHPFLLYYGPLAFFVVTAVSPIREVLATESIPAKIGLGALALLTPLGCLTLIRWWRWPKGILPKRTA